MTEQDQAYYVKLADDDKARYERELNELYTKGYFMMEDGSKSNEYEVVPKKKRGADDT